MLAKQFELNSGTDIHYAIELLKKGETVAIPTETVYGLAANAFDPDAVLKIFTIKNRPHFNPLIVHIASIDQLHQATDSIHPLLKKLAEKFWPGPLTILSPKSEKIHDLVTAGNELVAIRVPRHPLTLELLNMIDFPLAAPSANEFGRVSPTNAKHVFDQLGDKLPYILDGGSSVVGVESTIIKMENEKVIMLRPGGISREEIADVTGYLPDLTVGHSIEAPGMLKSHYAPKIPLLLGDFATIADEHPNKKFALMNFQTKKDDPRIVSQVVLSQHGDLSEAARNLFSALHELEKSPGDVIIAELLPEKGLGLAINDRLKRASS